MARERYDIGSKWLLQNQGKATRLAVAWRTVELWTLPAEQFLAQGDVGVLPWIPLMQMEEPPEVVLEKCAARIQREAEASQQADLLAVSEVMTGLRFGATELLT